MVSYLESLFGLSGKRAVVTGAGRGLGKAMALALARAGCEVVLCARSEAELQATAREMESEGGSASARTLDIADDAQVSALFDDLGPVDILVHAAAIYEKSPALDITHDAWRTTIGVNLSGGFWVCTAAARSMVEHSVRGSIVIVASVQAFQAQRNRIAYAASKGGLVQVARSLAGELGDHGIRVNCILPGFFHTESNVARYQDAEFAAKVAERIPLGRAGDGHELASAVLYLASSASGYTTGSMLVVDGGLTSSIPM